MSDLGFLDRMLDGAEVEWKPLGSVSRVFSGYAFPSKFFNPIGEGLPLIRIRDINSGNSETYFSGEYDERYLVDNGDILIGMDGDFRAIRWRDGRALLNQRVCRLQDFADEIDPGFLFYLVQDELDRIHRTIQGSTVKHLSSRELEKSLIPVPTREVQGEIVRILDSFTELTAELTAELAARKKQYNHYRDQLLTFAEGEVEWKALGDVFDISAGGDAPKDAMSSEPTEDFNIPILSNGIGAKSLYGWTNIAKVEKPSLTVSARGTIGWTSYREEPFFPIVRLLVLTPKAGIDLRFAYHFMKTIEKSYKVPPAGIPQLTRPMIQSTPFPVPFASDEDRSLAEQARIVANLDTFDTLTTSLSDGLPREIALRQKQYEYYRDLLLSFPKPADKLEAAA